MFFEEPIKITSRIGCLLLAVFLTGCAQPNTYVEPPPPKVTIAQPVIREVTDYLEFTGTTAASEKVQIQARVTGFLQDMQFQPGTDVKEGDLLFVIDPSEYDADLQAAEADRAAAQADFKLANTEFERASKLFEDKAVSEAEVVSWLGKKEVANAAILRAEATIVRAKLNVGYTQIKAPVSGRVGRNLVDVGNLVGSADATVLTEITRFDPMYVYFKLNERDFLRAMTLYRERVKEKGLDPSADPASMAEITVELGLANEEGYPHPGIMDFTESELDPDTGTLQLRGVLENKEEPPVLRPGLFARIRMPVATRPDMPLVSERAIGADQSGQYVLVVNSKNIVEKRNVTLGQLVDGMRVMEEGVRGDDWVVVNGLQRARPGTTVDPEKTDMASLATPVTQTQAEVTTTDRSESEQDGSDAQPD